MSKSERSNSLSRKSFIKKAGLGAVAFMGIPLTTLKTGNSQYILGREYGFKTSYSANDHVQIASIGVGGMGQANTTRSLSVPGTKLIGVCDLYDSRLLRCKERYGDDIITTKDYRELIARDDVDAVLISTSDHWHKQIAIEAMENGKAVYLEKPMVQFVNEGYEVLEAEERSGVPLMIGSQRSSSLLYEKARELLEKGEIGELNFVEAYWDRRSAMGAWQYSIPPSASPDNIDWERYREGMPPLPFNASHFFRWRNYDDYGTGVAGDLFVHLFSGLHMIADTYGPDKIMATGGLRYWHDGRDAEDVVLGLCDYPKTDSHPAFNLSLRVNFADGSGGGHVIRLTGSDGVIEIAGGNVTLRKIQMGRGPGMSVNDFDETVRAEYEEYYSKKYPETRNELIEPNEFVYRSPDGYSDHYDHHVNFINAVREGKPILQNGTFGMRACAPALLSTHSLREETIIRWNPTEMVIE